MLDIFTTFYSDQEAGGEAAEPSAGTKNTDTQEKQQPQEVMIPKSRFDEVNNKYKEVQAKLDALLNEKAEAERKAAEQKGEFEKLYKETSKELEETQAKYKSADKRAKELEAIITEMLNARLENLPEELRDIIPEGLTPEQKLAWIDKAERKGLFGNKAEEPVGGATNPPQQQSINLDDASPFQKLLMGYARKQ